MGNTVPDFSHHRTHRIIRHGVNEWSIFKLMAHIKRDIRVRHRYVSQSDFIYCKSIVLATC